MNSDPAAQGGASVGKVTMQHTIRGAAAPRGSSTKRRAAKLTGVAALAGLIVSATGLTGGFQPAAAAPNGGDCGPNNHFGRLVADAPAASFNDADLTNVAKFITETSHVENVNGQVNLSDSQDESDIDAGYTYVGQFIDHDITLDPRPTNLTGDVDPWTLVNNRTPSLDLDSVYGNGPTGSPQLYESDGMSLKLGARQTGSSSDPEAHDLLRGANGQAIIGDGRNDENKIVASFHSIMTRFHNKLVRDIRKARPELSSDKVFAEARQQVRWYYQWAILTDFLPTMSSQDAVNKTARYDGSRWSTTLNYYDSCRGSIPTEFAVASYRWHTMVRNDYQVNDAIHDKPIFNGSYNARDNLAGGQSAPSDFGFDWDYFFRGGSKTPQEAYKFDNSLVPSLGILPPDVNGGGPVNLSERNLLRGNQLRLPSGQDMARSLGIPVLRDDQIIVGPALGIGAKTKALTDFSPSFAGKAPLWAYVAAESVNQAFTVSGGKILSGNNHHLRLGPISTVVVNETLVGLMANDPNSVINHPEFKPDPAYMSNYGFKFRDLIRVGTSRLDAPQQVCTTAKPAPTIWNWWFYLLLPAVTTCNTPVYANPTTAMTYTVGGAPAPAPTPAPITFPSYTSGGTKMMASSSVESGSWGMSKMYDSLGSSSAASMGWSSNSSLTTDHSEWVMIDKGATGPTSYVNLTPRTDGVNAGYGFPVDFRIETSTDNVTWTPQVAKTGYAKPGGLLQLFSFPTVNARYVRIVGTKLRANPNDGNQYRMQLSELAYG